MDLHEAKRWYDGYFFSAAGSVYNPNSVMENTGLKRKHMSR
ncbi:hypothetical protein NSB25_00340 [Acetatifactor muris]|nr:hypothetical protein [Acetatifactor muris]MCR2045735.1 hypothetical protein [Acetatifactor muris]